MRSDFILDIKSGYYADTSSMPTSYQKWVWEREEHINWYMVMQRQHPLLELP